MAFSPTEDARMKRHKTGYLVWQFGQVHWHRKLDAALRHASEFWAASHAQVIECATGILVYGRPQ